MRLLFILFVVMPILEMVVLIKVGGLIGAIPTVGLVLLTATIGLAMLRHQGLSTLARAQDKMREGALPAGEMVEGLFLAVGGALLLTPGFITDAIGFACLIPGLRFLIFKAITKCVSHNLTVHVQGMQSGSSTFEDNSSGAPHRGSHHATTLDGEYKRED